VRARVSDDKALGHVVAGADKAGKPVMEILEPRIKLLEGAQIKVEDQPTVGTGNYQFYRITECAANPQAVGYYLKWENIRLG
jgi:hypothetical protein